MNVCFKTVAAIMLVLIPQIIQANVSFLDWLVLSDRFYAREIEVKAYIVTQEQVCATLCDPPKKPHSVRSTRAVGKGVLSTHSGEQQGEKGQLGELLLSKCLAPNSNTSIYCGYGSPHNCYHLCAPSRIPRAFRLKRLDLRRSLSIGMSFTPSREVLC